MRSLLIWVGVSRTTSCEKSVNKSVIMLQKLRHRTVEMRVRRCHIRCHSRAVLFNCWIKNCTLGALQMKMTATCGIQKFRWTEKIKHLWKYWGVVNAGRPLQVKYWGVATPATRAALTPMSQSCVSRREACIRWKCMFYSRSRRSRALGAHNVSVPGATPHPHLPRWRRVAVSDLLPVRMWRKLVDGRRRHVHFASRSVRQKFLVKSPFTLLQPVVQPVIQPAGRYVLNFHITNKYIRSLWRHGFASLYRSLGTNCYFCKVYHTTTIHGTHES